MWPFSCLGIYSTTRKQITQSSQEAVHYFCPQKSARQRKTAWMFSFVFYFSKAEETIYLFETIVFSNPKKSRLQINELAMCSKTKPINLGQDSTLLVGHQHNTIVPLAPALPFSWDCRCMNNGISGLLSSRQNARHKRPYDTLWSKGYKDNMYLDIQIDRQIRISRNLYLSNTKSIYRSIYIYRYIPRYLYGRSIFYLFQISLYSIQLSRSRQSR